VVRPCEEVVLPVRMEEVEGIPSWVEVGHPSFEDALVDLHGRTWGELLEALGQVEVGAVGRREDLQDEEHLEVEHHVRRGQP